MGDYVIVHVGFALSRIDPEEAKKVFEYLREMQELADLEDAQAPRKRAPERKVECLLQSKLAGRYGA